MSALSVSKSLFVGAAAAFAISAAAIAAVMLVGRDLAAIDTVGLLLAALWTSFTAAMLVFRGAVPSVVRHALLIWCLLVFGADMALLARAIHFGGHYPDGLLLWALGALVLALLVPSEPVAIAGLLLAALWSTTETFGFWSAIHGPFLILWAAFMALGEIRRWQGARHIGFLAALYWCAISIVWRDLYLSVYQVGLYVPIAMILAFAGDDLERRAPSSGFGATLRAYALILGFIALYGLGTLTLEFNVFITGPGDLWTNIFLGLSGVIIAFALWRGWVAFQQGGGIDWPGAVLLAVILGGLYRLFFDRPGASLESLFFELVMPIAALWLTRFGNRARQRATLFIGLAFLVIGLSKISYDIVDQIYWRNRALAGAGLFFVIAAGLAWRWQRAKRAQWAGAPGAGQ